jgi:Transposase DDE domain
MDGSITNHPFVGEAAMKAPKQHGTKRCLNSRRSLREVLQDFLTPALWKQAHQKRQQARRQKSSRWATQPLVLVLLLMTWCSGDSQAERFEIAKAYCQTAWLAKRRGCGKSVGGFQTALKRVPLTVLRTFAAAILPVLVQRLGALWLFKGFVPIGCDGSRVTCPRSAELEKRLGAAGKDQSAPSLWVTALVHLRWGLPLAWRFGKSNASERFHLLQLLSVLPRQALLVADAGYVGFQLAQRLVQDKVGFLLRMCSNATLYRQDGVALERYREGVVYYWPSQKDAKAGALPLRLRLLRLRAKRRANDVWLLTNVMEQARLPLALAGQFYRWRWQNEGCFRTYKHTLKKVKLVSRSLRLVHREAEGSWLALQLLLAQGVLAQKHRAQATTASQQEATKKAGALPASQPEAAWYSPRQILLAMRQEMSGSRKRGEPCYEERLRHARGEERPGRTSAKASRAWPRRKPHKPPKPPQLLMLTEAQKSLLARLTSKGA